jgi:aspartyl-tRNA(Asn)/glutamyl-tRNA(Gln) amidotransferase subunit A
MTERLHWLNATEASAGLLNGQFSSRDLIQDTLDWIAETDAISRAWVTLDEAGALAQADEADRDIRAGRIRGPLHGIGFGVKDVVAVADMPMKVGSALTEDFVPRHDAPVVTRMRAAGGICIGKTVTHEFAFGSTSPPVRNPWDGASVPGGSSGGSAAAVAAGQVPVAVGTDCCCSVRNPAALTGICGVRPTFGRVSTTGVVPASLGLDTVGPLCRTVHDTAVALGVMCGYDPSDPRSSTAPVPDFSAHALRGGMHGDAAVAGLRVGVPISYFFEHLERDVEAQVRAATKTLEDMGAVLCPIELAHAKHAVPAFFVMDIAEEAALQHDHLRAGGASLGEDVQRWAEIGNLILAKDYIRSQQMRSLIIDDWGRAFAEVDVIVTPATAATAKQPAGHPIFIDVEYPDGYVEDVDFAYGRFLIPVSLAGLAALVLPCGQDEAGLPVGLQIVAPAFDEGTAFLVGAALESRIGFAAKRPSAVAF